MSEPIDRPTDAPIVTLNRATVAAALESGDLLWYYSTRTGWLHIQLVDLPPPPANSISTSSEPSG